MNNERRDNKAHFQAIVEANPIPSAIARASDSIILCANDDFVQMFGSSVQDVVGQKASDFYVDPSDRDRIRVELNESMRVERREVRLRTVEGKLFWAVVSVKLLDFEGEKAFFSSVFDITREVEAELRARQAQQQLAAAMDGMPAGLLLCDADDRVVSFNSQYTAWFPEMAHLLVPGTHIEELIKYWIESGHAMPDEDNRDMTVEERLELFHNPKGPRLQGMADGRWQQLIDRKLADGGTIRIRVDVTELKLAEQELTLHRDHLEDLVANRTRELAEKSALLEATFESISEGFALFDTDDRLVFYNENYVRFTQPIADLIKPGVTYETLLRAMIEGGHAAHPGDTAEEKIQTRLAKHRKPHSNHEVELGDGRWLLVAERKTADGGIALVQTDITESKRAEATLRESEERFRDFTDAASDWLWETDENHRFTEIGGQPPLGPGMEPDKSLGRTREELAAPGGDPAKWRGHRADMESRRPFSNFVYRRVDEVGDSHVLRVSGKPIFDAAGKFLGYRGVGSDMTALVDAEERARSAQERLAIAMDGIPGSVVLYDGEDKLIFANRASRELNEAIADTLRPGTRFEVRTRAAVRAGLYPEAIGREEAWLRERLEQHRDPSGPVEVERQDGRRFLVHEQRLADGGTLTTATDITELKLVEAAAARNRRQLALHLENTPMAATGWDANLICTSWNRAAEEIFGYTAEEAVGRPSVELIVPEAIRDEVNALLTDVMAGEGAFHRRRTNQNVTKDGRFITCEWFNTPLIDDDGAIVGVAALGSDITDKLKAEEELRLAKEEADAANRAKSEFLSNMSHELRTPMNAILGFGQILQADPEEPLSPNQGAAVNQILKGGEHLLELINEVLDLAGVESGQVTLTIEAVDPGNVIESCLTLAKPLADERGIGLVNRAAGKDLARISADATRFRQALLNLVSNAIKYNRDGGAVTVDAEETDDGMVRLSVADTGPGIPAERQNELFQPFSRLDAKNTEIEGTGIGLTISKRLVELMGGQIGFESNFGKGSVFWIELPLAADEKADRGDAKLAKVSGKANKRKDFSEKHVILYVEDDPASLKLMERIVGRMTNSTLISTDNAESALHLAETHRPDLILMDIDLPGMNGIEALEHLRADGKTRDIPVIALSANAMTYQIKKGMKAGFLRYLTKPIQIENLMSAIKEATGERSGARPGI